MEDEIWEDPFTFCRRGSKDDQSVNYINHRAVLQYIKSMDLPFWGEGGLFYITPDNSSHLSEDGMVTFFIYFFCLFVCFKLGTHLFTFPHHQSWI